MQVEASIEGVEAGASVQKSSRAIVSNAAWKSNSTFGLWVVPYQVTGATPAADVAGTLRTVGNYADNVKHTYAGASSDFTADAVVYYPSATGKVDLYAVSPYATYTSNTLTSTTAYPHSVAADQSAADGSAIVSSDLMTAKGSGSVTAGAALSFRHRMSKALITFTVPAQYKNQNVTAVKSVELCGVPLHTTVNLIDSTALPVPTGDLTPTDILAYQAIKPASGVAGDYTYEAIVVPGSKISSGSSIVRITLTVGAADVVFNCKLTTADHTFVSKKQTAIHINIEDLTEIKLDPTKVVIAPWGNTAGISGSTSKMSKMLFEFEDTGSAWSNAKTCTEATLVIENLSFTATKVEFVSGSPSYYLIEYDHGVNAGGYLETITLKNTANGTTVLNAVNLKGANGGTARGYQIKGDPTLDSYNLFIGKITVTSAGNASVSRIP